MARAYGWNAQLLLAEETEYGEMPANNYRKIPFISTTLDSEQNLVSSNVLGLGRDPTQPFQDVINVDGDMVVPVDMRNIGVWLKAIFGIPSTEDVDDGVYTHSFESGKIVIPSYTLEVGLPEVPQFIRFMGVRANSIAFNFQRSGEAQVTLNLIGQGEAGETTAIDTNPEVYKYTRVSQFQGFIKSNGALLANITAASATYSNNLEKIETIRNDGKVEAIDLGVASLSGSISARYGDNILLDKARAGTPVDIELGYQLSDNLKL
ncbi:MAG: hypothetical protein KIC51_07805 [Acetobacter sp.]|nr:hypothetical protein [Acetobacter sp.]